MTPQLQATLKRLPDRPGVYLLKNERGDVLYVGKAQSLRGRVRSYWQKQAPPRALGDVHRIREVIDRVADVEYTLTDSVSEALLLEANLIKRFRPRFNVRLKDDKSYPYIKITLADDFPRIERTRKLVNDGSRYFGPYASASSVDESMNLVRRLFPFRTCTIDIRDGQRALQRPCLLYHIKRCQGPCIEAISKADYRADIEQVELFLEGRQEVVVRALRREMAAAADQTEYERAANLRDKIRAIERTMESQKMAAFARTELDLFGMARQDGQAATQLFAIRNGKMIGRDVYLVDATRETADEEVLGSFLAQYYARASSIPREVYVPFLPPDAADIEAFLTDKRGSHVRLHVPQRGERRELMALAARNAGETLAREQARWLADQGKTLAALEQLAEALNLAGPPMRIECYDISNFQGAESVGSMVVFEEGKPRSGEYRRFRIKGVQGPNDFASHQEVLRRRFRLTKTGDEGSDEERRWAMPDIVIVDGGKGQVSAAKEVLDELGLHDLPLAGLAKEREELFLPGRSDPILLPPTSSALYLVQRLRDEAHRFAITYHRDLRAKRSVRSAFDDLPGRGAEAQARAAQGVRIGEAGPRRAGGTDRSRSRDLARPRRADQGHARGVDAGSGGPGGFRVTSRFVRRAGPILIILIGLAALFIDFFPNAAIPGGDPDAGGWRELQTKLGLDLEGGLRVEYLAQEIDGVKPDAGALGVIRDIVEDRVNTTGVSEPVVQTQGADRIVVELPGVTNPDAIRRLVGQTGRLDFVPLGSTQMTEGQAIDLEHLPAAVPRERGVERVDRPGPDGRVDRQLPAQGHRREAVRRLHARPHRRVLRDRPRRQGRVGAADQLVDPRRSGPDRGRRPRRVPGQ